MEQKGFIRNISGTACVLGLALSTMSINSTMLVNGNYEVQKANYSYYDETSTNPFSIESSNVYEQKTSTRLDDEAKAWFGTMRDATSEEQASVNNYIKSIAIDTGVNFFDLC